MPTFEYTVGGPVLKDRTWFFFAGRNFDRSSAEQTGYTNVPFISGPEEKRFEGKSRSRSAWRSGSPGPT